MARSSKLAIPERPAASLEDILLSQGFGTRRECRVLCLSGQVGVLSADGGDAPIEDPDTEIDPRGLTLVVSRVRWPVRTTALVLLHKPAGYECSQKPKHHPSVMTLLPPPLRNRGVQPIGRLDEDTTGLLLLTEDGALIHRLTSPKHHVPKVYDIGCKHPVDDTQIRRLLGGVVLDDDPAPVRAAACERRGEQHLRMTLTEGKYHQVKRMLAAVGNRVETLHRSQFGPLALPDDLAPGRWEWLEGWPPANTTHGSPSPTDNLPPCESIEAKGPTPQAPAAP